MQFPQLEENFLAIHSDVGLGQLIKIRNIEKNIQLFLELSLGLITIKRKGILSQ